MLTPRFGLDDHTFLVATIAILVGVQVVGFGVIARHFAAANGLLPRSKSLDGLLSPPELAALSVRAGDLGRAGRFPAPEPGYHSVPWPLV